MAGTSVAERLKNLHARIADACRAAGREPSSVRLLAVSKLQDAEKIREAFACGQVDFGENYVQEALKKQAELSDLPLRWHFIGRLQSNKLKQMARKFTVIHSLERMETAILLNKVTGPKTQDIFVQVNIARELSKGGADARAVEQLLTDCANCDYLRVMGLMVMPPLSENPEDARPHFRAARELLIDMREKFAGRHPLTELSMGTSHDFAVAIAEGATIVRIGSEVFGPREKRA